MKNAGKEDKLNGAVRPGLQAKETQNPDGLSTNQKEKMKRYVRFFRRFGANRNIKRQIVGGQPSQNPSKIEISHENTKIEKSKEFQRMVPEMHAHGDPEQAKRRKSVNSSSNKENYVLQGRSRSNSTFSDQDEPSKNNESSSELDDLSCDDVGAEPVIRNRASGVYITTGTLRQIPNRNPKQIKNDVPQADKKDIAITFEYNCKESSAKNSSDENTADTFGHSFVNNQFEANVSLCKLKEPMVIEGTPQSGQSPQLFSESMSIKSLSELSNVYDPFKDDLQDDLHQF